MQNEQMSKYKNIQKKKQQQQTNKKTGNSINKWIKVGTRQVIFVVIVRLFLSRHYFCVVAKMLNSGLEEIEY